MRAAAACPIPTPSSSSGALVFNVVARNQDDHTKNIAFLMDADGQWSLSPAFDLTYAYNPDGAWTSRHQMTLNGKRDGIRRGRTCWPSPTR